MKTLVLFLLLSTNTGVYACTPLSADATPPWPERLTSLLEVNEVIFIARIEKVDLNTIKRKRIVSFTLLEQIKGNPNAFQYIETGPGDGNCSPDLSESKAFLVMANSKGEFKTAWGIDYPPVAGSQDEKHLLFIRSYVAP